MATQIKFARWNGGDGNTVSTIGYCIESPFDVLKKVMFTQFKYILC